LGHEEFALLADKIAETFGRRRGSAVGGGDEMGEGGLFGGNRRTVHVDEMTIGSARRGSLDEIAASSNPISALVFADRKDGAIVGDFKGIRGMKEVEVGGIGDPGRGGICRVGGITDWMTTRA
jgi:hypothetical protein